MSIIYKKLFLCYLIIYIQFFYIFILNKIKTKRSLARCTIFLIFTSFFCFFNSLFQKNNYNFLLFLFIFFKLYIIIASNWLSFSKQSKIFLSNCTSDWINIFKINIYIITDVLKNPINVTQIYKNNF